jgi:putative membrane protein
MKSVICVILLSFAAVACAGSAAPSQDFLDKAAQGSITEVTAGKLAMDKATAPDVREFAERLVKERRLTHQLLKALAASHDVELPKAPSPEQRETLRQLHRKSGAAFDHAYVAAQIAVQEESVALLKAEIALDRDTETKAFAKEMLPTIEAQLKKAYELVEKEQRSAWVRG